MALFHSTYYLSVQQSLDQSVWFEEKSCHSEFKSAASCGDEREPEQCTFSVHIHSACGSQEDNLSATYIWMRDTRGMRIQYMT